MSTLSTTSSSSTSTSSRITSMISGLDTDSLVKSMTSVQQAKIDAVKAKQTKQEWYNDALSSVQDELDEFLSTYISTTGSSSMLKSSAYTTYKATTSSTANAASITASSSADMGSYTIQINKLAANASASSSAKVSKTGVSISDSNTAQLGSLSFANSLFGTGSEISFAINGKTFSFDKETSLQSMINTINTDTTANVTMKYSRLTDTFSITADSGGAQSSVEIVNYKGNAFGANSAFNIGVGTITNGRSDAEAVINGTTVTRSSNDFTIDGVTYGLKKVTQGTSEETVSYTLERDVSSTVESVSKFIDAYNTLYKKLKALYDEADYSADYTPLTDAQKEEMSDDQITAWESKAKSGILRHNSDLQSLMKNLKGAFTTALGGSSKNASNIGITSASYYSSNAGEMVLDEDKLTAALQTNSQEVISMFTNGSSSSTKAEQGLIYKIKVSLNSFSAKAKDAMETAEEKISSYDTQLSTLSDKLEDLADRYYKKFSNMETALSKLNTQASYISQMFSSGG